MPRRVLVHEDCSKGPLFIMVPTASLGIQVAEPLKAMVNGAPLEDARHLAQRYDRMRQDAEAQATEFAKRQARSKDTAGSAHIKLQIAESKMQEITSSMALLGKEAAAALSAVETQQQRLSLQRLTVLVEAERNYHRRAAEILDQIQAQMVLERQQYEGALPTQPKFAIVDTIARISSNEDTKLTGEHTELLESFGGLTLDKANGKPNIYLAEVTHAFDAESENELSLMIGDFVVVRQVSQSGWSEGECKGKAGWFPSAYVEYRQQVPARKLSEAI